MGTTKRKLHFAWLVLIGLCIMVGLGKGINNAAGLFLTPVSKDIGVGMGNLTLYLSVSAIVTMIFLPIGGKLMNKFDTKLLLTAAIILQAGSYAVFGLMNSVWGWYIFAIPLAVGGVFITVIAGPVLINQWFKKRNGLALGIMGASVGLLGVIIQPVIGQLISSQGWRASYIIVGLGIIVIVVPIILFLLRKDPKSIGMLPYGADEKKDANNIEIGAEDRGISFADAKKSAAFFALIIFFFMITSFSSFAIHIPTYLINQGFDVGFAGNVMAAQMVGLFIGSLAFGYLTDKIGAKKTTLLAMIIGLISIVLLLFFAKNAIVIAIAVGLFGLVTASIGTLAPAITTELFGNRDYSQIYSTVSMGLAVASIVALPVYGYVFDLTGGYTAALYTIIVLLLISIACIIIGFRSKAKMVQKGLWR
ncbi:MAG TPA: MFS transporter [Bacillota bacterium]|nr:MFS transporter [Bacillota bacterium]